MDVAVTQLKSAASGQETALRKAAQELEVSFLAEMLQAAGLDQGRTGFGGGEGEDQFASFLVQEHARAMVKAGGIGLSDMIFNSLVEREENRNG